MAQWLAPHAEAVAHALGRAMAGKYEETAPLAQRKRLSAQQLLKNDRSQRKARRIGIDIEYDTPIKPYIDKVPPYALQELTGVSKAHC